VGMTGRPRWEFSVFLSLPFFEKALKIVGVSAVSHGVREFLQLFPGKRVFFKASAGKISGRTGIGQHENGQGVIDHGLVVNRQELFGDHLGGRIKTRGLSACKHDAFESSVVHCSVSVDHRKSPIT
jgi:hypothetical protein